MNRGMPRALIRRGCASRLWPALLDRRRTMTNSLFTRTTPTASNREPTMETRPIDPKYILAVVLAAAGLAACTPMQQEQDHRRHHPGRSVDAMAPSAGQHAAQGGMGAGMSGGMGPADKEAMCARYRSMRDAPGEHARQAMMEREMGAMSPEMRQHHMDMMRKQCQ